VADLEARTSDLRNWVDNLRDQSITESTERLRCAEPQLAHIQEVQIGIKAKIESIDESVRMLAQRKEAGVESQNGLFAMLVEQLENAKCKSLSASPFKMVNRVASKS